MARIDNPFFMLLLARMEIIAKASSGQGLKNGKVMWWGTITISKDGKTRTAILHSTDAEGRKYTVEKVYDRV